MLDKLLKINKKVQIEVLRNGKKYLLIKTDRRRFPLFIKNDYFNILDEIKDMNINRSKAEILFGKQNIQILMSTNILVEDENKDVLMEFDKREQLVKLDRLAVSSRTPLTAVLELTYKCNYKCKYCYIDQVNVSTMKFEDIETTLNKLKEFGVTNLIITGGEPFLHKRIIDIVGLADKLGFTFTVQTNGSFINEEIAKELAKYDNYVIAMTFHSAFKHEFEKFTLIDNSYEKTLESAKILEKYGIKYLFKYPVTIENVDNMKDSIKFLEDNKIPFEVFYEMLPNIDGDRDNSLFRIGNEAVEWLYDNGYCKFGKSYCSACKTKLWVSPEGEVYPCELVRKSMGNILEEDMQDIWYGNKAEEILSSHIFDEPEKCSKCDKKEYCNYCLAYKDYDNWSGKFETFCVTASIVKKVMEKKEKGISV